MQVHIIKNAEIFELCKFGVNGFTQGCELAPTILASANTLTLQHKYSRTSLIRIGHYFSRLQSFYIQLTQVKLLLVSDMKYTY